MPVGPDSQKVSLGESARVSVAGQILCVKRGTLTESPPEINTTCTGSGGFQTRTRGPLDCVLDLEAQWRWEDNPFGNPPTLEPGEDTGGTVLVYPDFANAPDEFWQFTVMYVASRTMTIDAEGVQTYTCQLKNQGAYMSPSRASFIAS